ncbi:uncharacterized protein LOC111700152 [Eurytemora carolleeae]|uniref:uncharacterized protein LOC111700152 n=1 Tax=Eurytemora carolleeae TaxID=1294199 RepID=UPI000C7837D6|nr:uncharacterized protein LOC111700152 [Eurytemora carolleeae]|eukprot:XP_023326745.1 uncharacterized protein LOC111700152 [Eurytemora affinis]
MLPILLLTLLLWLPDETKSQLDRFFCSCAHTELIKHCAAYCNDKPCESLCEYKCGWFRVCGTISCSQTGSTCTSTVSKNTQALAAALNAGSFRVLTQASSEYEHYRKVFNAACTAKPKAIVFPNTPEDVAFILKTAKSFGDTISVRSGGHSYTCNSLKQDSVHIIMTNFNRIKLFDTTRSETGKAAWLGTGAIWGNVLRSIDPEVYSYPHGQCRSVGVGGYLLGGGVNWLGTYNKYGYGAEGIIEMKAVLSDGNLVTVTPDKTVFADGRVVQHTAANNLFFGLRGAGSSLAIVTEFLYTIHKEPETRPAIILAWMETEDEVEKMMKAMSSTKKYSFMVNHQISKIGFWSRPILSPIMLAFPGAMQALKFSNRKSTFPVQIMVTDITLGAGRTTSAASAAKYLKDQGVDILVDNIVNVLAINQIQPGSVTGGVHFVFDRIANLLYEEIEKEQESWKAGVWSSISLNYGSLASTRSFSPDFINDGFVGLRRGLFLEFLRKDCSFCFWMLHFRNRLGKPRISVNNPISIRTDENQGNTVEINLTCMFPPSSTSCTDVVNGIRSKIESRLQGQTYSKYYNFPSCSKSGSDWRRLYWGQNLDQLMSIKRFWDSGDTFNHCQSLTNNDAACCPFPS